MFCCELHGLGLEAQGSILRPQTGFIQLIIPNLTMIFCTNLIALTRPPPYIHRQLPCVAVGWQWRCEVEIEERGMNHPTFDQSADR
jgi:hypothetical protein